MHTVNPAVSIFRLIAAFFLALSNVQISAHPLAQGTATLHINPNRIMLELTVSQEQVLIAGQWGRAVKPSDRDLLVRHGDYLLRHIGVSADGQALVGKIIALPVQLKAPLKYRLEYSEANSHAYPTNLTLTQNLLRDIEFAPGNFWEVSYRLQAFDNGQPITEALFNYQTPLQIELGGGYLAGAMSFDYAALGLKHILNGYDHLLFICGLVLAIGSLAELCLIILLFTVAHSLTMSLAVLDLIRLSPRLVEPFISFSIVAVALQNIFWLKKDHGLMRYLIAFGFGLFHGMGFAGGLIDYGADISGKQIVYAILSFSIGVECGHLLVVTPVYGVLAWLRNNPALNRRTDAFRRIGSSLIGVCGLVYGYFSLTAPL